MISYHQSRWCTDEGSSEDREARREERRGEKCFVNSVQKNVNKMDVSGGKEGDKSPPLYPPQSTESEDISLCIRS